jgi:hypothetical protein
MAVTQVDKKTILDSQINGLQSSSSIAHPENIISHTATSVLLRNELLMRELVYAFEEPVN